MFRHTVSTAVFASLVLCLFAGCRDMFSVDLNPFSDPEDAVVENVKEALTGKDGHSKFIGDYISVRHGEEVYVIEGIGVVVGLDGTGGDPGPPYREQALDELRKRRVPRPEEFLGGSDTALVLVRGYVPPLVRQGDRIDVEVVVPDGTGTTSLRGGVLLETILTEHAYAPGRGTLKGKSLGKAQGAILGQVIDDDLDAPFLRGFIPGGAIFTGDDRHLTLRLHPDYAYYRMSTKIAQRIGERFYDYDRSGIQRKLAEAKTHSKIELHVHSRYRNNYARYRQCIRNIMLRETPVERNLRMKTLGEELLSGQNAARAALQLEAIGREAVPYLKAGLKAESLESRFHAAQALAYIGETSGVEILANVAIQEPALRVYALAALSATESPEAMYRLNELLSHESMETRYGAFRTMTTIAPRDPLVAGKVMRGDYQFHALRTSGPPMVHLTRWKKAELVLFDADQEFLTPLVLRAGRNIIVRSNTNGDRLVVSLIAPGYRDSREVSLRIAEVIETLDEFGARYPDVVQLLVEADRQGNLPGRLGIDALPQANRVTGGGGTKPSSAQTAAEHLGRTPNMFDSNDPTQSPVERYTEAVQVEEQDLGPVDFVIE